MADPTPDEVAEWLLSQVAQRGELQNAEAVEGIRTTFGLQFLRPLKDGSFAIAAPVRWRFNRLHRGSVEYRQLERVWVLV
jgi:hypothetical protein